ncbi:RING-variant domain containing protein [Novymonas esmeraldas]|uniref:RING-variant domain containing protein n=1 Tax=Novymonas esmeraldas TaxID=1808958 RepID=A0AAW0F062_9TRYP
MQTSPRLLTALAVLAVLLVSTAPTSARPPASATPTLSLFDINSSRVLSTTEPHSAISFGERSIFTSPLERPPLASIAPISFHGDESGYATSVHDFLVVPYCVTPSEGNAECDLRDRILYVMLRFRHRYEGSFEAFIWQDPSPLTSTATALEDFKARLNRTDVIYPKGDSAMRMEDSATCSDITDECYLSRVATYTQSYKSIDPAQNSARFLFRVGKRYTMNGPLRLRVRSNLPHDAETVVDVVLVLSRQPAVNLFNHRWWIESSTGRVALLVVSAVTTFAFLTLVREVGARLARQRTGDTVLTPTLLYSEASSNDGVFFFLHRVAVVATNAIGAGATIILAKARASRLLSLCCARCRRWLDERRRRAPVDSHTAEAEREIAALNTATVSDGEEDDSTPTCRICRCADPRDDLFAPCACNGSSRYVHHRCLEQWREMTSNPEHRRVCAECKTPYTLVRIVVPQNPDLVTSSPIIEPVVRHYVSRFAYIAMTLAFAVSGAFCLKATFYVATVFDSGVMWGISQSYNIVLTIYFILAVAVNLSILEPFVKDIASAELQLGFVLLSLLFIEIPMGYATSAFLSIMFERLLTWEVSYGVGLASAALLHLMDVFSNFSDVLESFSEEREVVAARAERDEQQPV